MFQIKVWKRRNTLCISSFQTAYMVQKIHYPPQTIRSSFPINKNVLVPLREQGQKKHFCGTPLFAGKTGRLCTVPTHCLPVNAGNASEDTLESSISPCPQRPICRSAFRSALSFAVLSVDALPVLLPLQWFAVLKLWMLYNKSVRLSSTNFLELRTNQYSRTTPRTMPMISA